MNTFEDIRNLLISNRTFRRFQNAKPISLDILKRIVELVRYTASGRNAQPLKYVIVNSSSMCAKVYTCLKWAGYYTDWDGPEPGERPVAYIVQCLDTRYGQNCLCDDGLQLQAITMGTATYGIGGCIIKSFNVSDLHQILNLPEYIIPRYVLALGYPAEKIKLETMSGESDADFRYYRTEDNVHHVPKRPLDELIITVVD